ncbi:MAG: hypothetical protein JZD40_02260 [Sulfolobus sp.]|nr:hypothetical protein [Sulfolobus sp.]
MSTEALNNTSIDVSLIDPELEVSKSLSKAISLYSFVKEVEGEDEDLRKVVEYYLNEWIKLIGRIDYNPKFYEIISSLKASMNDIFKIVDEEELSYLLAETVEIKKRIDEGQLETIPSSYITEIKRILNELKIDNLDSSDMVKNLVSMFILIVGILTLK